MHIPDGILPVEIAVAGYGVAAAGLWYSLRKINQHDEPRAEIPKAAMFTAAFFVASWIHIPLPPVSVHLVLNGLMGVVLGWYAVPAIVIGLFFQAVMFGHGGLTTLGVNAAMMALPAVLAFSLFRLRLVFRQPRRWRTGALAFLAGAVGIGATVVILFVVLITTISSDLDAATARTAIYGLVLAHIPLVLIEGLLTALVVLFLGRVQPGMLDSGTEAAAPTAPVRGSSPGP